MLGARGSQTCFQGDQGDLPCDKLAVGMATSIFMNDFQREQQSWLLSLLAVPGPQEAGRGIETSGTLTP